jgi:probable rRNA maturation factor
MLTFRNHQRTLLVNLPLLRQITQALLRDCLHRENFELEVHLLNDSEMTRLNETFLRHRGSTDVITFDYGEQRREMERVFHTQVHGEDALFGEIFICLGEALAQSKRFHTTWQSELVRYIIHGILHLCGYDDRIAARRRGMKSQENRLLALLAERFPFVDVAAKGRSPNPKRRKRQARLEKML